MLRDLFRGTIRKKLLFLVLTASLPALLIILFNGVAQTRRSLDGAEKEARLTVKNFSEVQVGVTSATRTILHTLALMPAIRQQDIPASTTILASVLKANPIYGSLLLLNLRGDAISSGLPLVPANYADRTFIQAAMANGEFTLGEYTVGRVTPVPIFPFAQPVYDDSGHLCGVLTISIKLEHYGRLFEDVKLPQGSYFGIADRQGARLYRYPADDQSSPVGAPVQTKNFASAASGKGGGFLEQVNSDGTIRMVAYAQLRLDPAAEPYMYMFTGIPKETIFAEARANLIWNLGSLALAVLLALAATWVLGGTAIARDLETLAQAAKAFGQGDDPPPLSISGEDGETGLLAKAFEEMRTSIRGREAERQEATAALALSEEKLRTVADHTYDWEYWRAPDGRLVWMSPSCLAITGYTVQQFKDDPELIRSIILPEDQGIFNGHVHEVDFEHIGVCELDFRIRRRDGHIVWISHHCLPIFRPDGVSLGRRASNRDITDRKKAQEALLEAKDRAELGNKVKSQFLANMSHEIRTPLNGVLGLLQVLEHDQLKPAQRELVVLAAQSGRNLLTILNDILDLSKIEAGKFELFETAYSIRDLVSTIQAIFAPQAAQKELYVDCRVDESLPDILLGDDIRLRQVLFNLLGNAVKFTDTGGITLTVDPDPLGRTLRFTVADTGIGIAPDQLARIFEPFTQADGSFTRRYGGTGLGLGLAERMAKLMGGSISLSSTPGQGTTVAIEVPLVQADQAPLPEARKSPSPACPFQARILLVEDEQINLFGTSRILERQKQVVFTARNGKEALEVLAREDIDAVLMDMQMPVMDGMEATSRIRAGQAGESKRDVPIIALTAHAMKGDQETYLAAGCNDYLAKPVDIAQLMSAIGAHIGE